MAGERKGKTYEAITFTALQILLTEGVFRDSVFWNKRPQEMSIEPDLTIGPSEHQPTTLILITQSGAAGNSHMKGWRNLGELVEAKTVFAHVPAVYNLVFDSVAKEELKKVQAAAFDGQLIVGDLYYGDALQKWVDNHLDDLPVNAHAKSSEIESRYKTQSDPELVRLLDLFIRDLRPLLISKNPPMDGLWERERSRTKYKAPVARTTYVRRGAAKLLVAAEPTKLRAVYRGNNHPASDFPPSCYLLGFLRKFGPAGNEVARPADSELESLFALFQHDQASLDRIIASVPQSKRDDWSKSLEHLLASAFMCEYVVEEFDKITNAEQLATQLRSLHDDPMALVDPDLRPADWPPRTVWLFEILVEILKVASGTANGYGYAQFARECAMQDRMPPATDRLYRIVLPDWLQRLGKEKMRPEWIEGFASVLSRRVAELGKEKLSLMLASVPSSAANNLLEAKLMTYRGFEPLATLIQAVIPSAKRVAIRSCFAEAAGLQGQAGKTTLLQAKGTLINWQSVSDAGRDHKKKELCGRAVALRFHWDGAQKKFGPRPGVKKLILVLDGTWRQPDLDVLVRSGWDEIYYPDEMSRLAQAIV